MRAKAGKKFHPYARVTNDPSLPVQVAPNTKHKAAKKIIEYHQRDIEARKSSEAQVSPEPSEQVRSINTLGDVGRTWPKTADAGQVNSGYYGAFNHLAPEHRPDFTVTREVTPTKRVAPQGLANLRMHKSSVALSSTSLFISAWFSQRKS